MQGAAARPTLDAPQIQQAERHGITVTNDSGDQTVQHNGENLNLTAENIATFLAAIATDPAAAADADASAALAAAAPVTTSQADPFSAF